MAKLLADDMAVCVDCLCEMANGESARTADPDAGGRELLAAAADADSVGYWAPGDGEASFSSWPCDRCGDTLHGDRYAAAILG